MKTTLLSITLLLITVVCTSQEKEKRIKFKEGQVIICTSSEMNIRGYDGDEVIIRNLNSRDNNIGIFSANNSTQFSFSSDTSLSWRGKIFTSSDKKEELEKGLRPLGETSTNPADNLFLDITKKPGELYIKDLPLTVQEKNSTTYTFTNFLSQKNKFEILVPHTVRLLWNVQGCTKKNSTTFLTSNNPKPLELNNFKGEVEISTAYKSIKFTNVTGPTIANSIGGNITVVFDKALPEKLYSLVSNSGYIDVTIPPQSSLSVNASAKRILSNIDFNILKEEVGNGSKYMDLQLNSGKVKMKIDAGSGSIYLRANE